jgi:hypothetical protein
MANYMQDKLHKDFSLLHSQRLIFHELDRGYPPARLLFFLPPIERISEALKQESDAYLSACSLGVTRLNEERKER